LIWPSIIRCGSGVINTPDIFRSRILLSKLVSLKPTNIRKHQVIGLATETIFLFAMNYHSWASASRKLTPHRHSSINNFSLVPDQKNARLPWLGPVPDLSWHHNFFHSGTGMIGCQTVRHSGIYKHEHEHVHKHALAHAHTPMMCGMNMDRNMDVQHGHEAITWTCTMDMEMDKHHRCWNARLSIKSLVWHR
jgi:hypothetical protein